MRHSFAKLLRTMRVLPLALVATACYRYAAATPAALGSGNPVRVELNASGTTRLAPILGQETVAIEGMIVTTNDTSVVMAVSGTRKRNDPALVTWAGENVAVPRAAIQGVELRLLDKRRTTLVVIGAIAAAIAVKFIVAGIDALAGGDDGGITPPPP
jgi:hypothetical protein